MWLLLIGITIGVFIGYKVNNMAMKVRDGINFKFFGYTFYKGKNKKADVLKMEKKASVKKENPPVKEEQEKTPIKKKCELCNNEDMFIAGTKNLMPCPKCKRNKGKFRTKLG